ncbi:MAG: prepilin-type N-terminal cleavage/methylation domain-containing protein [Sulfuriferula sp.]
MMRYTYLQRGFSLVELMVGMVIGLIATLVIAQVYSTFEGLKRTTTGGADAQTNGTIALYSIQRDAGNAGFGLPVSDSTVNVLNCPIGTTIDPDGAGALAAIDIFPVVVTDGGAGAGNSDSVTFRFGAGAYNMGTAVTKISSVAGTSLAVSNSLACKNGDVAIVMNTLACNSAVVNGIPDAAHVSLTAAPAAGASIACLGQGLSPSGLQNAWNELIYSVVNNQLALTQNV